MTETTPEIARTRMSRSTRPLAAAALGVLAIALASCAAPSTGSDDGSTAGTTEEHEEHDDHDHDGEDHEDHADGHDDAEATEASSRTPRLALTYDGGILVVDATTLETVADLQLDGFNRLAALGDGRHVAVSTTGGWAVLDAGTWSVPHGDHSHYYTAAPALTDVLLEATTPGHAVHHDGLNAFFDDGTGDVTVVETSEWTDMVEHGHLHPIREYTTEHAHHGVAVATANGDLFVTRGDDSGRTGAMLLDADDAEIAVDDQCPGVHGESAATDADGEEFILAGCENGALVLRDGTFTKLAAPDAFGRIGNAFSVEGNDIVLGDYKTNEQGGIGLTQISLIDLGTDTITPVDPFGGSDAEYTWRGLARGDDGEILVLGTDGVLRVLDTAGAQVREIPVIDAWEVPEEWQTAHPALTVLDGMAYVTEPATGELHAVDFSGGTVWKSGDLGRPTTEIAGVTG